MPTALRHLPLLATLLATPAFAADTAPVTPEEVMFWINNTWMLIATFMVFLMHLGFAALEAGMTQAKNTVNILFKNVAVLSIGLLTYGFVGFELMYPGEAFAGGWFGLSNLGLHPGADGMTAAYADGHYTYWTDFIFQAMFAATAATIVSGAVAERIRLHAFLLFAAFWVAIVYPMVGMWHWGGGWLQATGFHDFAGSTIVHSVGGWGALMGAWMLGPRLGRFSGDAHAEPKGHSLPLAAIGVLLLWFGWYGFNGGSVLSADPAAVSLVVVTTTLSAAMGMMVAATLTWGTHGHADLGMALNGALAGLVGITAGADVVTPAAAVAIGAISGVLVVSGLRLLERVRLDDPVGAVPVHLICGIWGTVAVGLFSAEHAVATQLIGVAAAAAFCAPLSFGAFWVLDRVIGLRVSAEEEHAGLDLGEHGMAAYTGLTFHPVVAPREPAAPMAAK